MSQCSKHPGTERVILKTGRGAAEYVGCPKCKAEKDAAKVAAPAASTPAKKTAVKKPAKKAAGKSGTVPADHLPAKKAAAKSTPPKRVSLIARLIGRRG